MSNSRYVYERECGGEGSSGDDCPLTLVQAEWLTLFFGYTDDETAGMTRAAAAAALDEEWAEVERTGQTRRAGADGSPDRCEELFRDPMTRPEELLDDPILYYVEVAVEEVPARRHSAALREVADVRDTLGLPPIEVRWFMYIGTGTAGEAVRDAWYRRTFTAFAAHGVRRRPRVCEIRQHPHRLLEDWLGFVYSDEPCVIYVQTHPSPAQIEDMQMVIHPWRRVPDTVDGVDMVGEHTLTEVIRHEMAHCYQILAGFEELVNNGQMTLEEFECMAQEMAEAYCDLRQQVHDRRRWDLTCVLDVPAKLENGKVVEARPGWRDDLPAA